MGKIRLSSKSSDLNYPSLKPTLNLNFAAGKSLDPRITFTRNSTATYVGSDGLIKTAVANEPRFEHDPVTGECLGLMVEESRTNLLTNSEDFSTWTYSTPQFGTTRFLLNQNISTINSPDGLFTSDLLTETKQTVAGHYRKTLPISAGSYYCISCYVYGFGKYSSDTSSRRLIFGLFQTNSGTAVEGHTVAFNLGSTSVTSSRLGTPIWNGGTGISTVFTETGASIISIGNGWKRVSVYGKCSTANPLIILTTMNRELDTGDNDGGAAFTMSGDGFSGVSIWGVQGEAGSFPTSYIPTSGSTVTRAADNASITGTNFTDWYSSTGGTLIFNGKQNTSKITSNTLSITPDYYQDKNLVSSILYYPRSIDYSTLKALNLNSYTNILTNGLLVYLDVANSKSYPGYGTILNGLANSGITGTLLNGVSYNSANGGSLVFNGINQYCNTDFTLNNLNTNVTIGCWIKTSVAQLCGVFGLRTSATIRPWEQFQFYISGDADSITSGQYINYNEFSIDSGNVTTQRNIFVNTTSITTGNWVNIVATSDSTKSIVYINGVAVGQNTNSNRPQRTSEATLRIGGAGDWSPATPLALLNGYYFNGSFSNGFIYNRALSAAEIQQNFNATRSLFGV